MVARYPESTTPDPNANTAQAGAKSHARSRSWAFIAQFVLMLGAAGLAIASIPFVYWHIVLRAPQYPKGLFIDVYVDKIGPKRNVFEVDGLNHYIGMIKLTDAATIERAISIYAIPLVALLALVPFIWKNNWAWLLRVPLIVYPFIFVLDLFAWLYYAGHSLDPHAPMSSSISEFTPKIIGEGTIGQFSTSANFEVGFYMALAASLIALGVTIWEWRTRNVRPV